MIFKHHRHETKQVMPEEIPQRYQHLLIPHARHYFVEGLFGCIISQEIREEYFVVWQHHFFIDQPCVLTACNQTETVALNYMLEGSPHTKIPRTRHEPLLEENNYRLFYVPVIEQPVSFTEGNFNSVHINYHLGKLHEITENNLGLQRLLIYIVQKRDKLLPYQSGPIDMQAKLMLLDLLWYKNKKTKKHVESIVRRLLLQYIWRHHNIKDDLAHVEKYVLRNINKSFSVTSLAAYCCKSKSEFSKLFKLQYGQPPKKFTEQLRVRKACKYLIETRLNIAQVAEKVGCSDISTFNRMFKRHMGCTPGQYRSANVRLTETAA